MTRPGVAPFTGAWIEMPGSGESGRSHIVAPFTGAWIEIGGSQIWDCEPAVAPFTGAWIEMVVVMRR